MGNRPFELSATALPNDASPPDAPAIARVWSIDRNEENEIKDQGCGMYLITDCGAGQGLLTLNVAQREQPPQPGDLGHLVTLAGGALPRGMSLPDEPIDTSEGFIYLWWTEGNGEDEPDERLDFALEIAAVDRAGNVGPGRLVVIRDLPDEPGGCTVASGHRYDGLWTWALLALGILLGRWEAQRGGKASRRRLSST